MTAVLVFLLASSAFAVANLYRWFRESSRHKRRLQRLTHRIHVNGIRGKSTVTRILAGMLREAGVSTIAKSTGTAAAVITPGGEDEPIFRPGQPTILEQLEIVERHVTEDVEALVIECMALKPEYQEISERLMVRSTIGVLTNVREDHQDVMGETLTEIARSLMSTCPRNSVLVTAERNPDVTPVIEAEAARRGTRIVYADPDAVSDDELASFDYVAFKENIAIGLAIAGLLGIDRQVAMRGMIAAPPDPGVLRMRDRAVGDKRVTWANLFAVNDRESMIAAMERLRPFVTEATTTVGILNNRADRERRAMQFADIAVRDLDFDRLVTFGAYEKLVTDRLADNGYPPDSIINLGETRNPTIDEIIDRMVVQAPSAHVLVVGFVNIHTHQAELMLDYFEGEPTADTDQPQAGPHAIPIDTEERQDGAGEHPEETRKPQEAAA